MEAEEVTRTQSDPANYQSVVLPPFVDTWLAPYAKNSRLAYRRAARRLIAALRYFSGSDARLETATEHQVLEVSRWFEEEASGKDTWNQTIAGWKSLFDWMVDAGIREMNPTGRITLYKLPDKERPTPTKKEVRRLWRGVQSVKVFEMSSPTVRIQILRERALLALMVGCGLRASEMLALTNAQFDFPACRIRRVLRKRRKLADIPWHPKATKFFRPVINGAKPDWPTFPHPNDPTRSVRYQTLVRWVKQMCVSCRIPVYTPHAFRRFAVTSVFRAHGIDKAKEFADHASIETTYMYLKGRHERVAGDLHDDDDDDDLESDP